MEEHYGLKTKFERYSKSTLGNEVIFNIIVTGTFWYFGSVELAAAVWIGIYVSYAIESLGADIAAGLIRSNSENPREVED